MNRIILLLSVFTISFSAHAQPSLGLVGVGAGWQDTVYADSTYTFNIILKNTGDTTFIGNVDIDVALDTIGGAGPYYNVSTDMIFALTLEADSIFTYSLTHTFTSTRYVGGNNTVVIWPSSGGVPTTDTIRDTVYVIFPMAINEPDQVVPNVIAYPNPVVNGFWIQVPEDAIIRQVLVHDASGRLVSNANTKYVDMNGALSGFYIVRVIFHDDRYVLLRIVKP